MLSLLIIPVTYAAQGLPTPSIKPPGSINVQQGGVAGLVCTGLSWLFTAAILFSVILALLAAFDYMRSSGDPGKVKSATNRLVFVAIGVAVAILARTVPVLIGSIFGAGASGDTSSFCR